MKLSADFPLHASTQHRLENLLASPSHGYVFYGPRYLYKLRAAEVVACALADAPSAAHPNITRVSLEEKAKSIKIAQIKAVIDQLSRLSFDDKNYRVVIIEDAHLLTADASNALLKVLEEPGERIVFILVTERLGNLLPTVRSRVQSISFVPPIQDGVSNDLLDSIISARPRLKDMVGNDPQAAENMARLVGVIEEFLSGNITQRFASAKLIAESGEETIFVELLEEALRTRHNQQEMELIISMQDRMQRNVNSRLCMEMFALEAIA